MLKNILLFTFILISLSAAQASTRANNVIECTAVRLIQKDVGFELGYKIQITRALDKIMMDDYSVNCQSFLSQKHPGAVVLQCEDGNVLKISKNKDQAVLKNVALFTCR